MKRANESKPEDSPDNASQIPAESVDSTAAEKTQEPQDQPAQAVGPPPDGGTRAWTVVIGGWCCYLSSYGWLSSIGVFQTYYEQNLLRSYSSSTIAWILSVQVFILNGMAPVNGKVFDSYGSNALITIGTFLHVFGIMMISISSEYYQLFLAQSICSGIGAAMIFHGATNAVATWFSSRRGLALGLASSGASIGGVIMPLFGRIFPPWIGDHIGRFNTAILSVTFGAILVLGMWIPSSTSGSAAPSIIFAALYGLPLGCFAAILPALVGQITTDIRTIGVRLGSTFFVTAWAGLTGQPIAGALVQRGAGMGNMQYVYLKVFCGVTISLGAALLAAARISSRGWRLLERA
ncbi:MAG: hypothetical protein Q9188_000980 [Gyalolechia gomerana]